MYDISTWAPFISSIDETQTQTLDDMQICKSLKSPESGLSVFVTKKVIFQLGHLTISKR